MRYIILGVWLIICGLVINIFKVGCREENQYIEDEYKILNKIK